MPATVHVELTVTDETGIRRGAGDIALGDPEPVVTPGPPPAPRYTTPGVHDDRTPATVKALFPGAALTRPFVSGVLTVPGSLVPKVASVCAASWAAALVPVCSLKLDPTQVRYGEWDKHVSELAAYLNDAARPSRLIFWHEPEDDAVMQGGAFVEYFNYLAARFRTVNTSTPLGYASMAYQWLPNAAGTASTKGATDVPSHWQGVRADFYATDVYSGSSVPATTILPEHKGVARWLAAVVPAGDRWSVTERGWLKPKGQTMTTADRQQRAAAITRETDWLLGTDEGRSVESWIYWNTDGREANPNLMLDTTHGEPALRDAVRRLAEARVG